MEKVLENQTYFKFLGKFKYYIEKLFIPNRNFIVKNNVYSRIFQKKVLLLGQSYNSVLGFSSTCISYKKRTFYFLGLRFYSYIKSFAVEPKLIKYKKVECIHNKLICIRNKTLFELFIISGILCFIQLILKIELFRILFFFLFNMKQ